MKKILFSDPAHKYFDGELSEAAKSFIKENAGNIVPVYPIAKSLNMSAKGSWHELVQTLIDLRNQVDAGKVSYEDYKAVIRSMPDMLKAKVLSVATMRYAGIKNPEAVKASGLLDYADWLHNPQRDKSKVPSFLYAVAIALRTAYEHAAGNEVVMLFSAWEHKFCSLVENSDLETYVLFKNGRSTQLMTKERYLSLKDVLVTPYYETGWFTTWTNDLLNDFAKVVKCDPVKITEYMSADENLEVAEKYFRSSESLRYAGQEQTELELTYEFCKDSELEEDIAFLEKYSYLEEASDVIVNAPWHDNIKKHLKRDGKLSYDEYLFNEFIEDNLEEWACFLNEVSMKKKRFSLRKAKALGLVDPLTVRCKNKRCRELFVLETSSHPKTDDPCFCPYCGAEYRKAYRPDFESYDALEYRLTRNEFDLGGDDDAELTEWEQDDLRLDGPDKPPVTSLYTKSPEEIVLRGHKTDEELYLEDARKFLHEFRTAGPIGTKLMLKDKETLRALRRAEKAVYGEVTLTAERVAELLR